MNLINKKTTMTLLAGFAVLALSGCGSEGESSDTGIIPGSDMTTAQAKDAMALNAFIYPIIAPVTNIADCLVSTKDLQQCIDDALPGTEPTPSNTIASIIGLQPGVPNECTPGHPEYGTYTYDEPAADTVKFTFSASPQCKDYGNSQNLHDKLVLKSCFLGLPPIPDSGTPQPDGTYRIEYTGSVECTSTKKTATNSVYRTIGNTNAQTKSEWAYNGTLDFGASPLAVTGSIRGIAKYAVGSDDPTTSWDNLFLGSDEEWTFENVTLALGSTLTLDGKGTYIKHPNDNNNGDGEFFMEFTSLAYAMTHNGADILANVTGTVSASCQLIPVTYATTTVMEDINNIRDARGYRMPSSGTMTMTIPDYNPAPAVFSAGNSAQVAITASEGTTTYTSWRDIIGTSSCAVMQDWMDNIIQPKPPVVDPAAGEIIPGNVLYDDDAAFVLAADKLSATGKTAGRGVVYYLLNGQGYTDGQTVGETNFQFAATGPSTPFVNVYLHDENGDNQRVSIYSNATWNQLKIDHPTWTIRTDYIESDFPTGTIFQGNFILRIGDSTYAGSGENFAINNYVVELATP